MGAGDRDGPVDADWAVIYPHPLGPAIPGQESSQMRRLHGDMSGM